MKHLLCWQCGFRCGGLYKLGDVLQCRRCWVKQLKIEDEIYISVDDYALACVVAYGVN